MLTTIINGVLQGLMAALTAVAVSVTLSVTRTLGLAQAALFALAPFVVVSLERHGAPFPIACGAAILVVAVLSALTDVFVHWPLERHNAGAYGHFIASLGVYLIVLNAVLIVWGSQPGVLRTGVPAADSFGTLRLSETLTRPALIAVAVLAPLIFAIRHTRIGVELRALACDRTLLALYGRNERRLRVIAVAMCGALLALAAILTAVDVGFDMHSGLRALLAGIAAAFLAGSRAFATAALAAILIAVGKAFILWHLSAKWEDPLIFAFVVVALISLPRGLASLATGPERLEAE